MNRILHLKRMDKNTFYKDFTHKRKRRSTPLTREGRTDFDLNFGVRRSSKANPCR
jgi:hypothetical protein